MIFLFTALYPEARALIAHYKLKRFGGATKFEEYYEESAKIHLVITGIGRVAAAAAVSAVCTHYGVTEDDFLVNFGICAGRECGELYLCNRLTEAATGRTFYPDILYRHPFPECGLVTADIPVSKRETAVHIPSGADGHVSRKTAENLTDMEAAGIYQAGSYFFAPHRMIFLKLVSDDGAAAWTDYRALAAATEKSVVKNLARLTTWLDMLAEISDRPESHQDACGEDAAIHDGEKERPEQLLERVSSDMHCSVTMRHELYQLFRWLVLTGQNPEEKVAVMYREGRLPCADKREGRRCLDEFTRNVL